MGYITEFISNLLYAFYFLIVGELLLGFERTYRKYEKFIIVIIIMLTTISWFHIDMIGKLIIHVFSIYLVMIVYFKDKKRKLFLFYLGMAPMMSMLSTMFGMVIRESLIYLDISIPRIIEKLVLQILLLLYISMLGTYFKKKYNRGLKDIGNRYLLLFVMILLFDTGIVVLLGDFVESLQTVRKAFFVVLYVGIVLGILMQLALLINTLLTRNIARENEALAKDFLDCQREQYLYLEKRDEETKKFRHDIKSHLSLLKIFIKKGELENAEEYIADIDEKMNALSAPVNVNNGIANAILNKFYEEAKEKGIKLSVKGRFPVACNITVFDMCTILSNLLSNAIHAERQYGGDEVTLNIRYNDTGEIIIIIENDYSHELKMEKGRFRSTKTSGLNHGYGLKNVQECVEKNKGYISITTDNHRFKVMLNLKG